MSGLRQKQITCPEEIEVRAMMYFADCEERKVVPNMPGLAYAMGFTNRNTVHKYRKLEGYEEYHDAMDAAALYVESRTAEALFGRNSNVAGPIFALKNMGWKDKEAEKGTQVNITLTAEAAKLL